MYCPDQFQQIICPSGSYCPSGTVNPLKCEVFSYCPDGSKNPIFYGGIFLCVILDLMLLGYIFYVKAGEYRRDGKSVSTLLPVFLQKLFFANQKPKDVKVGVMLKESASSMSGLENGFKRGLNGEVVSMDFVFDKMKLQLPGGYCILSDVSGSILGGRMCAIMGPSGAGKTTFMNVLMGKVKRTGGDLFVNDKQVEMNVYKKIIGYVPQEDIMHRELTVRENIMHSAKVRLPKSWNNEEIETFVDQIIDALNLTGVKHSIIGDEVQRGVSGGQKKRVNIGTFN